MANGNNAYLLLKYAARWSNVDFGASNQSITNAIWSLEIWNQVAKSSYYFKHKKKPCLKIKFLGTLWENNVQLAENGQHLAPLCLKIMSCTSADLLQNEIKEFQSLLHMYSQIWDLTLMLENQTWILLTNPIFIHAAFLNLHNQQYHLVLLKYTSIRKAWFKRTAELLNELRSIK